MADDKSFEEAEKKSSTDTNASAPVKEKRKGIFSRIWNGLFRFHRDDLEKRLQYISKEEAAVVARMKSRSQSWRQMSRNLIIFSVTLEVIAVSYAIMTTRSDNLDWKARASRVLPMFILPALSCAGYSALGNIIRMCERKDQKTLEKLRAERKAKIDELKEKTNYYTTQQLIQRYDTDPAAKAAAATVLASKLGADSGLKVVMEDESNLNAKTVKSNDVEYVQPNGLRNQKQSHKTSVSGQSTPTIHADELAPHSAVSEGRGHLVVEHHQPQGSGVHDGGWLGRFAALLVGEDPTQSYALICGNCHMHNGLARKEDFPFITYYCPHCHALNKPKQSGELSGSISPNASLKTGGSVETSTTSDSPASDRSSSPVKAKAETREVEEKVTEDLAS